ncbi:MAG: Clp protease ClpP [Rikenellaceae bacterium]
MQKIKINNSLDVCVIDIEGAIGVAEEWQFENAGERVATYERFRESLSQIEALEAQSVVVNIRSTGGDVNDAILIYEALCSLEIPITTRCYGYVASAATVIAQAASEGARQISANALYLVHNSTCAAEGNAIDLSSRVELLKKTDERLAELYARRAGRTTEEYSALMAEEGGNGRWLTAQETIDAGLADTLIDNLQAEDNSSIKNFWRKLGAKLGLNGPAEEGEMLQVPQNDYTVRHEIPAQQAQEQSLKLFEEQQRAVLPTVLTQVEDPSLSEVTPGKNQKAYANDVKAFRH